MYTENMKKAVRSVPVPSDFMMDVVEYPTRPPFLALRFYESQWAQYNDLERLRCIAYLNTIKKVLQSFGCMVALDPVIDVTKIPYGGFKKEEE